MEVPHSEPLGSSPCKNLFGAPFPSWRSQSRRSLALTGGEILYPRPSGSKRRCRAIAHRLHRPASLEIVDALALLKSYSHSKDTSPSYVSPCRRTWDGRS